MAEQLNNILILAENGDVRGLRPAEDSIKLQVPFELTKDLTVGGDLTVAGDIISRGSQNVIIQDPILDLGMGNSTTTATAGGFTVSMNRAAGFTAENVTTFVAGVGPAVSAPTFTVSGGSSAFVAGDIVAISGASDGENDGLYVVASVAAGVVTIKGTGGTAPSGSVPFAQTQFKAATGQSATAYKVDLSAAVFADGTGSFKDPAGGSWPKGTFVTAYEASATEAAFQANGSYDTAAQTSLQEAYETGNTITTSAAEGDVVIAGDQKLSVSATGGVQVSAGGVQITGGALDVNTSADFDLAGAFTVDGAQAVQIGSGTAVSTFTVDATGAISLDAGAASNLTTSSGALTLSGAGGVTVTSTGGTLALNGAGQTVDLDATTLDVDGGAMSFDGTAFNVGMALSGALPVAINATTFDVDASAAVTLTGGAASKINTTAGDLTLDAEVASLILDGGEAAADAVKIHASNAAGGIDIDAGTAGIAADTTGAISLDAAAASNLTVTGSGASLTLAAAGGGAQKVEISSAGTGADAVDINATAGGVTVDAAGAISLDSTATASNFTLTANDAGDATLTIAASNTGDGVANLDIDADGAITIDAVGAFSIDGGGASNVTTTGANLTLSTVTSGVLAVTSAGNLDMDAVGTATLDAAGISLDSAGVASNFTVASTGDAQDLTLAVTGATNSSVLVASSGTGADAIGLNASAGGIDVDAAGDITVDAAGALSLDSTGTASNLTLSANDAGAATLTIAAANAGAGAANLDIDVKSAVTIDSASISLDATTASNLTVTGSGESLTLAAAGGGAQQVAVSSAGTGADAIDINASAGGVDVDAAGAITLDAALSSNLTVTANSNLNQTLTLKASNSGSGQGLVSVEGDENIALKTSAGATTVQRNGTTGTILEVKKDNATSFAVSDTQIDANVNLHLNRAAGVQLQANASAQVAAGTICAFDSAGKMVAADAAAGGNSPTSAQEILRYPFASAITTTSADAVSLMHTVPGARNLVAFDTAPTGGAIGQIVYLAGGANAGKVTLTAPTTSNASIWRVGFLAGTTAVNGLYSVYWHPQYLGRRPVA